MAWRCRFLTARRSQHGRVIAEDDLVKNRRVHPTHWLISTQVDRAGRDVRGLEASCPVDAPDDDGGCCCLDWFFAKNPAQGRSGRRGAVRLATPTGIYSA